MNTSQFAALMVIGGVGPSELIIVFAIILLMGAIPAALIYAAYKAGQPRGRKQAEDERDQK